jgi:hypothetical protein
MKNSECTIYVMFKDRWIQKFRKEKDGWTLTTTKGTAYPCTAEQLLSHILPPIAGIKGQHFTVNVELGKYENLSGQMLSVT